MIGQEKLFRYKVFIIMNIRQKFICRQSFIDSVLYPNFKYSDEVAWALQKEFVSGFEVIKIVPKNVMIMI